MGAGRKPGPQCSYNDPVNIDDGTMCLAPSPTPGSLGANPALPSRSNIGARSVSRMTHEQKIEEAINRAREKGQISDEVLKQLPSIKQLVIGIVVVGGVVAGLGVTAGAVASTGVGAVLEGIAAGIVIALSGLGIVTSLGQIVAGMKTLMKFYEGTRRAQTPEDLDAAGKDFATGLAEAGVGTVMMILSVLGARQGLKMGKGAVSKWSKGRIVPEEPVQPRTKPREEPELKPRQTKPTVGAIDESAKAFSPKERSIARYLAEEGHTVKAVPESAVEGVRTPDALVDGKGVEFKSLNTAS